MTGLISAGAPSWATGPLLPGSAHVTDAGPSSGPMQHLAVVVCARRSWCHGARRTMMQATGVQRARSAPDRDDQQRARIDEFRRAPSVPLAFRIIKQDSDVERVWSVFQQVLGARAMRPRAPFFQSMMTFCRRRLPAKAPDVFDAAVARGIPSDELFGSLIGICCGTNPPMLQELLDRYVRCGPHTLDTMFRVAHVCRASGRPASALFLVDEAARFNADLPEKLLSMFAACCAEADSEVQAADRAQQLLDLIRARRITPPDNRQLFGNLVKPLIAHRRFEAAIDVLSLMDSIDLPPSVHLYTQLLAGLASADRAQQGFAVFRAMVDRDVDVSDRMVASLVAACGRCATLPPVETLHRFAVDRRMLGNDFIICSLVSAYDQCNALDAAERVFQERCDRPGPGPDPRTLAAMIRAYGRHGRLSDAARVFDLAPVGDDPDIWNGFTCTLAKADRLPEGLSALRAMRARQVPADPTTVACLVAACGRCAELHAMASLHQQAQADGLMTNAVISALIYAYAHCGQLEAAERVFQGVARPDMIVLTAMIAAYGHHGLVAKAFATYDRLKSSGEPADERTLASLLTACSHVGEVGRAERTALEFKSAWGVGLESPYARNCMIDLYGRSGNLNEAERLASASAADVVAWMSVLAACRQHGDVPRAERVFAIIQAMDLPAHLLSHVASAYVLMGNVYTGVGRYADARRLRDEMDALGICKIPGRTSLILPGQAAMHFLSGDDRYRADAALRETHARMMRDLAQHGYCPDVAVVVKETASVSDAKQSVCLHSEKLAIAYALKTLPPGAPVHAVKNLRVCPDCHEATKALSAIYRRDIYIRDANRHHHFRDGQCSCGDYW